MRAQFLQLGHVLMLRHDGVNVGSVQEPAITGRVTEQDIARLTRLHAACAAGFADAAAQAPAQLRKGPRGGGRDTEAVVTHVHQVEHTYATSTRRGTWPMAYYLRRSAYHYTDQLWEIQDRSAH